MCVGVAVWGGGLCVWLCVCAHTHYCYTRFVGSYPAFKTTFTRVPAHCPRALPGMLSATPAVLPGAATR